jgi:hypothetical protein
MTVLQVLDELETAAARDFDVYYASYAEQRRLSPHVTPRRWGALFADWVRFEDRYQAALQKGTTR